MDDFFLGLLGCSVLLGILVVPIVLIVAIFRRFSRLEKELGELRAQVGWYWARSQEATRAAAASASGEAAPVAVADAQPAVAAPDTLAAPDTPVAADTVVTMPAPAYFETRVAPPATETVPAVSGPSLDTVVSTPWPARFETQANVSEPTRHEEQQAQPPAQPTQQPLSPPRSKPGRSFEETLWTRLPVWIGAAALALAAAYLVKLSFERGWIGPGLRVVLGVLFGVSLLGAGEWLRKSSDYVAKGLSAAGIAALFISFFAATTLYQLIPPAVGFALLALTTATAVALSLRQGYIVAVVGLLGGFLTPALAASATQSSSLLFAYLLLLEVGLLVVARKRSWSSLSVLTLIGGLFWVFTRLSGQPSTTDSVAIGFFLCVTTFLFVAGLQRLRLDAPSNTPAGNDVALFGKVVRWLAASGALFAMAGLLASRHYGSLEWVFLGLITAGILALARLDEEYHGLAWLAAGFLTLMLASFAAQLKIAPERGDEFLVTHLIFGVLLAGGAFLAHFGSRFAGRWASLSAATGVFYLLMQYSESERLGTQHLSWGAVALLLGGLYIVAALPAARRRQRGEDAAERPLAAFAVGATTLLSLAVPLELERQWLTVAWALEVWALLFLSQRLAVRALRYCAGLLTALVAIRLLLNPEVISYPIGTTPVWNWLLYGYGIPLLAFVAASRLARRDPDDPIRLGEALEWLAQALAFALVSLEIRHFFYRDASNLGLLAPGATDTHLVEWGTYGVFWFLLVFGQLWLYDRFPGRALLWGSRIAFVVLTGLTLLFTGLVLNPLWSAEAVGYLPIFNWLLWIYGVPAVLHIVLAARFEQRSDSFLPHLGRVAALIEIFLLITFQVRQVFQGNRLDAGAPSTAENYAYSFAWLALAFVMAVIGVRAGHRGLRFGSALIMLLAVFKVFLFDTANLEGLLRVLSLFGLGVALFVLAYLYRRFVFPPKEDEEDGEEAPPAETR